MQKNKQAIKKTGIQTSWDMTAFYKSPKDPQIEKDLATFEAACAVFERKYKGQQAFFDQEDSVYSMLSDYESLCGMHEGSRPDSYFYFLQALNSSDSEVISNLSTIQQRMTSATNKLVFLSVGLGKISVEKQQAFLKNKKLEHFHYWLKLLFAESKHLLTEAEEKLMAQKSLTSHVLWVQGREKALNEQTVQFKGKTLSISAAGPMIADLPTKDRRTLHEAYVTAQKAIGNFAESEMNAIVLDKKINDGLRGFKAPYSATILRYQNDEKAIVSFVDTVTKHFPIAHKFYALKSQLLKLPSLTYAERAASVGKTNKKYPFSDAYAVVERSFEKTDPVFSDILKRLVSNGQVDVAPKKGKSGGAFCAHTMGNPTLVLLNHVDTVNSVMTFGHEMGHAIHSEMSKVQKPLYQDYTTSVAEVASTFFENIVFQEIFETLSEKEKVIALHDRIQDDIATVSRQIACFNFETELHTTIREKGSLPKEEIAKLMNKHMKAYLGPKFKLTDLDGYFFVGWGHIRRFFYVYSYAYAQLISKALYKKYQADPAYITEIKKFLSAGGSKSPEDIFKDIGIDTSKPEFFVEGLKSIEADIERLKKLLKK